jgi:hypothetical protein
MEGMVQSLFDNNGKILIKCAINQIIHAFRLELNIRGLVCFLEPLRATPTCDISLETTQHSESNDTKLKALGSRRTKLALGP